MDKILRYLTKDKLVVNLVIILIMIGGLLISQNIKREVFPATEIDKMMVQIGYPGASPSDVELNALIPIEDELKEISGIDEYTSVAMENSGFIMIELDQDLKDKQKVKDEIFRKITISNLAGDISDDVDTINVEDMNTAQISIYTVSISPKPGKNVSDRQLYRVSEILENMLTRVDGISKISKTGYRDREIHINVDPDKMNEYYLSLSDIVQSIKTRNIRSSGGTLQSVYNEKNIITIGQFDNPMEVGDVIIRSGFEQNRVKVKDVAAIEDTFKDEDVRIRVKKEKAVILDIKKKESADIITTVNNIKKFFNDNKGLYENSFDISIVSDESKSVSSLIKVVITNAIVGIILVLLTLLIFLDFKTSFWTAFSIPLCLFMVLIFMLGADYSINILTLGAIITVLGMMVDDAIVISESIYEKKRQGLSAVEAAVKGTKEVIAPVFVTILSTIVAFMPMLTISGTMGKFISVYPIIISITLLFSFLEAIFILPNHLASGRHKKTESGNWFIPVAELYKKALKKVLKFRYLVLISFFIVFILTIIVSTDVIKNFVLFWDNSKEGITVEIETNKDSSLNFTEKVTFQIEEMLNKNIPEKELVSIFSKIGGNASPFSIYQDNWSTIQIQLVPISDRKRTADEIAQDLRKKIVKNNIKGCTSLIFRISKSGPPVGEPVDIKVISSKTTDAIAATKEIKKFLATVPGVKDIDDDHKKGKEELRFIFDYNKMAQYGINVESVANAVRTAFEGTKATSIQTIEEEIVFRVKIHKGIQKNKNLLMNLFIPNDSNRLIRLKDFASLTSKDGEASIRHYNGYRAISVTADVDTEKNTPNKVMEMVKTRFKNIGQKYSGTFLVFSGESKESSKALSGLAIAFLMALLFILLILILLFRSFSQPFVVLSVIPFGLIGVLLAFWIHNVPLSFMGLIGVIGLSGVVVNDSIIMIEFINKVFRETPGHDHASIIENIAEGAKKRLRPIILTTVTTVVGLLPTVYGIGGNAQSLVPTVMAMAYGLLFATLLTLFFIPSLYMINEDIKKYFSRLKIFKKIKG